MKNNKPYKQYTFDRVYNDDNNFKEKNYNRNSDFSKNSRLKRKKKDKVPTNIRIDMNRINDSESLDTSFLEGRIVRDEKKQKKVREKVLKEDNEKLVNTIIFLRKVFFSLAVICVVLLVGVFTYNSFEKTYKKWVSNKKKIVDDGYVEKKEVNSNIIDNNYLFLGDFNTFKFDFAAFGLDYHYVKVASDTYTTSNLLDKLKRDIYDYNPSIIFYELGVVDINNGKSNEEIIYNIEKAIDGIKENRPYAKIYIESLYPVNKDVENYDEYIVGDNVTNSRIVDLNKLIKDKTKEMKVNYFDVYSVLVKDDKLNPQYTDNGVHLNVKGYEKVLGEIKKIVG